MSLEENKAISRRAIKRWSSGDTDAGDEIFSPNYVNYQQHLPDSPDPIRGAVAWKKFIAEFHAAFPDFLDTVELQVAEGDKVVTRFISQGTQTGAFLGHLPTGRRARGTGIAIDPIVGGKIVESWVNWDMMSMLRQLGLVAYPK